MSHTPGPWAVDLDRPFALGGDTVSAEAVNPDGSVRREICTCLLETDSHPDGEEWLEDAANARLLAAAPDLLEACQLMLHNWSAPQDTSPTAILAISAILKATGRTR